MDKPLKSKLQGLATKIKTITGGSECLDKLDSLIQENNLQGLMQECLQAKVKNMHQREILNLEREFQQNLDSIRAQMRRDLAQEVE